MSFYAVISRVGTRSQTNAKVAYIRSVFLYAPMYDSAGESQYQRRLDDRFTGATDNDQDPEFLKGFCSDANLDGNQPQFSAFP